MATKEQREELIKFVPIENLKFDPDNPRLPDTVNGKVDLEIYSWMLENEALVELMVAIGEKDYFYGEPLLVVEATSKNGSYIVVEGNRRLAAIQLLNNPDLAPIRANAVYDASSSTKHKPRNLPVVVFPNRNAILDYLGYRHITGIQRWDSLAKAKYLEQLAKRIKGEYSQKKFQSLARAIGSRWDTVAKLLTGLELFKEIKRNDFFDIKNLRAGESEFDFALLTTALGYSGILEFLDLQGATDPTLTGLNKNHLKELTLWVFQEENGNTKLGESRNLKKLNRVVVHPEALTLFRKGLSLDDADLLAGAPVEIFESSIKEARNKLRAGRDQIHRVEKFTDTNDTILEDIEKMARLMRAWIRDKLSNRNNDQLF